MNWTALLTSEIESTYLVTDDLLAMLEDDALGWKPATGENWMTTGQLVQHMTTACGFCIRGFVTNDWGMPEGASAEAMEADAMLPPADSMPSAKRVVDVREALAADKQVGLAMLAEAGEQRLATEQSTAPWDKTEMLLGQRLMHMVGHLSHHKSQLFYYLKLQGKPVNTWNLYGV